MKFAAVFVLLVAVIGVSVAAPADNKKCANACSLDYTPVCGHPTEGSPGKPLSFGNSCVLDKYNCEKKLNYVVKSQGECPGTNGVRLA